MNESVPANHSVTDAPLIRMENLAKVYPGQGFVTHALSGIYMTVKKGDFAAIEGPSGCGKSTLLSLLGLLDRPTSGLFHFKGESVDRMTMRERARQRNRHIGFIFQNFNLIPHLTVFENVAVPLTYADHSGKAIRQMVHGALDSVGMAHYPNHFPPQLSGGQQQRVAVARAMVGQPELLLADEPTGNLDSHHGEMVMRLLREKHRQGTTIVMVTHNPNYARYGNAVYQMQDGRFVDELGGPNL